jgi:hypothetical protein
VDRKALPYIESREPHMVGTDRTHGTHRGGIVGLERARAMKVRQCRVLAPLAALLVLVATARATTAPLEARVIWHSGDDIYLAAPDSIAVQASSALTFISRRDTVATAEVTALLDRRIARARLRTGSLPRGKDLERLQILAEPPRGPRVLRVGYPAPGRGADPSRCAQRRMAFDPTIQRLDTLGRDLCLTRLPGTAPSPWPETLIVREFADAADEEIALERGELDVAVFWPGEPSARMRDDPRWPAASTAQGIVVCDPALRSRVSAIGVPAFVELLRCADEARR